MGRAKDQELLEASRNGDIKTVGKLLELTTKRHGPLSSFRRSPSINCQDMNGYTSLHHACLNGHSNIVRLLLAHDVQLDLPDVRGSTSLYLASWAGHQDIVKMLLMNGSKGANPNAQTIENETPLHSAAQHGHNTVVAILLAYGADPCIRNNSFQTALDLASQFGRLQVVQLLLRAHPDLIAQYRSCGDTFLQQGYSPPYATTPTKLIFTHTCLHLASRNGHKKVVETLLAAGVDVNILTHAGTALHEAALCGKKSVVTTLLKAGVDVYATDGNGRTALDILKDYPPHVTYDIVTVITEYMNIGKLLFQPIQSQNGSVGAVIENSHSLPRRLYEKNVQKPKNAKLEFVPKPRNNHQQLTQQQQHQNGLSNSLSSLDRYATAPETYLKMKPIKWQKSATDIEVSARNGEQIQTYRPVYKQPYSGAFMQAKKLTEFDGGTIPSRSIEYINLIKSDSVSDEQNSTQSSDQQPHMRYRCVDDYVEMTEPESSVTPQPSPRLLDTADYANLPKTESETNEDKRKDSITDIDTNNNSKQLIFRSKTHSPTPDYPPPTVRQAEHTIFEYIQPLSLQVNNRHSGEIRDTESMEHNELSPRPTSEASDCVEHYVGDVPFAGLFKGSTLHLELDETDGNGAPNRDGLRSPSLVRSIPAARRSLSKQRYSTAGEDFSASRVWAEIDTIFETIGNEVLTAEHNNNPNEGVDIEIAHDVKEEDIGKQHTTDIATPNKDEDAVYEHKSTTQPELKVVITNNELRQSLHIRNPDELLLDSPCSPSGAGVNWCHSSYALIYGEIRYTVFYLGSTVIRCLQGTTSTRKSIQKLKIYEKNDENLLEKCNTSTKYLKSANLTTRSKLGIAVSHAGVKFLDQEKDNTFCMHDIENINCVCQDTDDLRYFAYITKEQELHYCHVFMVDNLDLAKEIILTLGQAFEVAYQLALSRQCTPIEEEKRCLEKEEVENI